MIFRCKWEQSFKRIITLEQLWQIDSCLPPALCLYLLSAHFYYSFLQTLNEMAEAPIFWSCINKIRFFFKKNCYAYCLNLWLSSKSPYFLLFSMQGGRACNWATSTWCGKNLEIYCILSAITKPFFSSLYLKVQLTACSTYSTVPLGSLTAASLFSTKSNT